MKMLRPVLHECCIKFYFSQTFAQQIWPLHIMQNGATLLPGGCIKMLQPFDQGFKPGPNSRNISLQEHVTLK